MTSRPRKKMPQGHWGKERTMYLPVVGIHYRVTEADQESITAALPLRVNLIREPTNNSDENAIKVVLAEHIDHFHIGYVPRDIAANLAPRLDENQIWLEASTLTELEGNTGQVFVSFRKKIRSDP